MSATSHVDGDPAPALVLDQHSREVILGFLAENPDIDGLLAANTHFSLDDVRAALAFAAATTRGLQVDREQGDASPEPSQGLPEPDGPMNKGSVFRSILASLKPGKLLDFGSERRGFPVTAAHLGWEVTSVGAREAATSDEVEERDPEIASLEREVTWLDSDIREFPIERGAFDLIAIHGLLHQLPFEEQVALFRSCAGTPLLVDAKVANANLDREGRYEGILAREPSDTGDIPAFMLTEDSLIRLARDNGYPIVLVTRPPHRRDFTFYLCLPKNWNAPGTGGKGRTRRLARRDGFQRGTEGQSS